MGFRWEAFLEIMWCVFFLKKGLQLWGFTRNNVFHAASSKKKSLLCGVFFKQMRLIRCFCKKKVYRARFSLNKCVSRGFFLKKGLPCGVFFKQGRFVRVFLRRRASRAGFFFNKWLFGQVLLSKTTLRLIFIGKKWGSLRVFLQRVSQSSKNNVSCGFSFV